VKRETRTSDMADIMSQDIPEDPYEASAFLEQQLHTANDRCCSLTSDRDTCLWPGFVPPPCVHPQRVFVCMRAHTRKPLRFFSTFACPPVILILPLTPCPLRIWALEDENREISNKLEFARENVKVLKRGYTEKIDEMQRKIDERDGQLKGIREEMQHSFAIELTVKDEEISALNDTIASLNSTIETLKTQCSRASLCASEPPLTIQQLEEGVVQKGQCNFHSSMGDTRGLSVSPAWGAAMSPIMSWAKADKVRLNKNSDKGDETLQDPHAARFAASCASAASRSLGVTGSASLASMRDTVKGGSPLSLAVTAMLVSKTQLFQVMMLAYMSLQRQSSISCPVSSAGPSRPPMPVASLTGVAHET
jgi:hypothetical protein